MLPYERRANQPPIVTRRLMKGTEGRLTAALLRLFIKAQGL